MSAAGPEGRVEAFLNLDALGEDAPSPMPTAVMTTNRLEAFSDGVFAVVITLLVLDLRLPPETAPLPLLQRLWLIWPKLSAYAITFAITGIYWVGHHSLFTLIRRVDRNLMWMNLYLLMCVSFIPFPASVMGVDPKDPLAIRLYAISLVAVGLGYVLIWGYASNCRRLIRADLEPAVIRIAWARCAVAPVVYAAAFLASWLHPWVSLSLFLVVPALYILPSRFDPRQFKS